MKITLSTLRRIIREVVNQESVPPGKWAANTGEPADEEDIEKLGEGDYVDEDESASLEDRAYDAKSTQYARLEARDMRREEEKFSKAKVYKSAFTSYKDVKNRPVY